MTAIIIALLALALYFQWSMTATTIITTCAIVALILDTRAMILSRSRP
ncbi:hypothetical protein [Corynebacterium cystitidis]|nr:hypothetical protein [Corynebacterium cystitidis]